MTLEVWFTPMALTPGDVAGRNVIVIDVLRATTTICVALDHGARGVIIAADPDEATRLAHTLQTADVLLAGERHSVPIPGFALGNSPREMTAEAVRGKTLVLTTSNGTRALLATAGAREVVVASAVNLSAAGAHARTMLERDGDLMILCAGRDHGFGMDDAYIAGQVVIAALGGRRSRKGLNDAALVAVDLVRRYRDRVDRVLSISRAGRELTALGFRDDIAAAAEVDRHPVLPNFRDRRVTIGVPAGAAR